MCNPIKYGGLGVTHPDLILKSLSIQRMLYAFKPSHAGAAYSRSIQALPFGLRTLVCHKDIFHSFLHLSQRWRADHFNIFSTNLTLEEPLVHPFTLSSELLAFNPFILKWHNTSFGNDPSESFLLLNTTTIGDILTSDKPLSWRYLCMQELNTRFSLGHKTIIRKINKAIAGEAREDLHLGSHG